MIYRKIVVILALLASISSTSAIADEGAFKLEELTCFDVISQGEEDFLFLVALLIGHQSGVTGNTEMSEAKLVSAIEGIDKVCGENPEMLAVEAVQSM
ncbi:hypothetical protein KBY24_14685 [Ruegeria pomeroyi]|nr:hypothetical protein [Ruegeria pomeroyi]MCE8534637.1 hypothetical protein [Ruegeria pomeroyi]